MVAYELLYRRSGHHQTSVITENDEISALANVLIEVGLDRLAGKQKAFVNVPESLLGSDALRLLPPKRVTLEILEDTVWSSEVEANILDLKSRGFQLALDDYTFEARHEPFLNHVDLVKVDLMGIEPCDLRSMIIKKRRPGQIYLAEKVETHEEFLRCKNSGFALFQGYFFSKPLTIKGTGVRSNHSMSVALLAKLQDPDLTMAELETLIVGNVALCHKVLRLANSVANGLTKKVSSINQALQFLGVSKIRTMASMAVISSIPGKPSELYRLAMIRAKLCEQVAMLGGLESPEMHFTAGLLSVLDGLTDTPMNDILAELPLAQPIVDALSDSETPSSCRLTLNYAQQFERGQWDKQSDRFSDVPQVIYFNAVEWARQLESSLAA